MGVPDFLGVVPGFWVFRDVPGCSGVPCSGVPCSGGPGGTTCQVVQAKCTKSIFFFFILRDVFHVQMFFGRPIRKHNKYWYN